MSSYGAHESTSAQTDVWLTPPEIIRALGPFDLDPCAAPNPRPWDTAREHITLPDDGLMADWIGRVWCNPPYGRKIYPFMAKLAAHGDGIALVFARTETRWFFESAWASASAFLFLKARLAFYRPDGSKADATAGAPAVLIAYGDYNAYALELSGLPGALVPGATVL